MNNVKINIALVRIFQFIVFVLFTFMVMTYFFAMVLLPLDAIVMLIKVLSIIGIGGLIAAAIALPVVGYLCLIVYKTPLLCPLVVDTGIDLIHTGKARIDAFNAIIDTIKDAQLVKAS